MLGRWRGQASMFAETVGLDDSFDFFFLTLARARQGFYAGQARPGWRLQCRAGSPKLSG